MLADPTHNHGEYVNGLLEELFRGYSVDSVRQLLHHDNAALAIAGAFLVSELGILAQPLLDEVPRLLEHPQPEVRFDALDCVLVCARREQDGPLLATASSLVMDAEAPVRWKAIKFLARAASDCLVGATPFATGDVRLGLRWLSSTAARDITEIVTIANDESAALRRFALAAAARLRPRFEALAAVAQSTADSEIAGWATEEVAHRERGYDVL